MPFDRLPKTQCAGSFVKTKQVARCGNAVCPPMATALVRANLPEWCGKKIISMAQLEKEIAV